MSRAPTIGPRRFLALPERHAWTRGGRVYERTVRGVSKPLGPYFRSLEDARRAAEECEAVSSERGITAARQHLRFHPLRIKEERTAAARYPTAEEGLAAVQRLESAGYHGWVLESDYDHWRPDARGCHLKVRVLDEDLEDVKRLLKGVRVACEGRKGTE